MDLQIFDITSVGNGHYRVGLRVSGSVIAYVVNVSEDPVSGLSGPHSLWNLLEGSKDAMSKIMGAVLEVHRTGFTELPIALVLENDDSVIRFDRVQLWSAKSSTWYLSSESINWASKHLITRRSNTLFPVAFEHRVIDEEVTEFSAITQKINLCDHTTSGQRQLLVPKTSSGARMATQLDPLDGIILTAIGYELGERLETLRIPVSEEIVFSFRFCPSADGNIWSDKSTYKDFRARTYELALSAETSFVAETDISAFYHTIEPKLVSVSLERFGVKRKYAEVIRSLLESLEIEGVPVGPAVSALFAEAILTPIDIHLLALGAKYVRFNDDFRFFCRSEVEARAILQSFADVLWRTAGLTMQDSKTRITEREEYLERFERDWFARLLEEANLVYGEEEMDKQEFHQKLVEANLSLLEKAVDDSQVARVWDCIQAFSHLSLERRRAVLPVLLDELGRVWAVAPWLSQSLEKLLPSSDGGRDLVDLVTQRLEEQSSILPDYAASWLLHAFWKEEWSGKESLAILDSKLDTSLSAARRELLAALRRTSAAGSVKFDRRDPWQDRAHVWATGTSNWSFPVDDSGRRLAWTNTLYEALTQRALNNSGNET